MSGAMAPSSGEVMARFRPRMISLSGLQLPNLSVLENTELMLRAHGRDARQATREAVELIELAELEEKTYLPYNTLSTGMRGRLGFFLATINQPQILLMDELLSVSDERFKAVAADLIASRIASPQTAVIASHSDRTIRRLCSRVIVLTSGRIAFDGEVEEGIKRYRATGSGKLRPQGQ